MKTAVPFRVVVTNPLPRVAMLVQRGRDELLPPTVANQKELRFEFEIVVDVSEVGLNFLGKYAQGPKNARFVYVNSGRYAGEHHSCWGRRAKLSLMTITREQVEKVTGSENLLLETTMPGVGKDGGPTCASVKGLEWKVVKK
jgi:hypothetical protein